MEYGRWELKKTKTPKNPDENALCWPLKSVAGIKKAEKRRTPCFLAAYLVNDIWPHASLLRTTPLYYSTRRIFILFLTSKIPSFTP